MYPIDNFYNVNNYIHILNGSLLADLIIIVIIYYTPYLSSKYVMKWYEDFRLSAILADVLIIMIGLIIARYIFTKYKIKWNIYKFIGLVLAIQIIHDILFYILFKNIPKGANRMLDLFKLYANEVSFNAILGDSLIMILAVLFTSYFASLDLNKNIIILITLLYSVPYLIYTK